MTASPSHRFAIGTLTAIAAIAGAANAQSAAPRLQTPFEALAQDAAEYARSYDVPVSEAMRRLRAQEESVATTDRLRETYRDRLAGISIEHSPQYRIVLLLTGSDPIADQSLTSAGLDVPILFRTGALATHDQLLAALTERQAAITSRFPQARGLGIDQRTGELVMMINSAGADVLGGTEFIAAALREMTRVPASVRILDAEDADSSVDGGARVEGTDPANGRRYACTTGFVVTDGSRTGIATAAHCPDALTYIDPAGDEIPLDFVDQWGARYQDVQINVGGGEQRPVFYADTQKRTSRPLTSWRNRTSTRAGDIVCRRGESSGYSCSEVEFVNYAPPGALCGGPCDPLWVTVKGPSCRAGDSGGPVFNGTIAFGLVKGGNYARNGRCNFYYYMSTDYLPEGWSLLYR